MDIFIFRAVFCILLFISSCESKSRRKSQSRSTSWQDEPPEISVFHSPHPESEFEFPPHTHRTRRSPSIADEVCTATNGCSKDVLRMPSGYNFFDIPFPPKTKNGSEPMNVTMKARVEKIRDIDEVKEEITLDMEITLGWTDWKILAHRRNLSEDAIKQLIADGRHLERSATLVTINNPEYLRAIWKPNLFIYDLIEKSQPKLMSDLITLRYDPNGGFIYYLTRVILKLSCPMDFHYFPADTQTCQFLIRGFSYNEKLLNLQWYKPPYLASRDESDFDVKLSNYEFKKLKLGSEIYNGLSFDLTLRRKLSYHMVQTYIPSSFFILITWLCFLIPSTMVEARIGISMTTLLTLTAMFASVRETSPISSYVKALDIWMVSCIFSVFLTLFEFTILTWLRHSSKERNENASKKLRKASRAGHNNGATNQSKEEIEEAEVKKNEQFELYTRMIEKFAFAVFFFLFVLYNLIYWSWLFNSSEYYDWGEINTTLNVRDDN